jgi:2-hydroxychromene-2-carboxylate isomerase
MKRGAWYFDFVSPFAYLHSRQLGGLDGLIELEPRPVLLAAMLQHWGQKGPAEIPGKRVYSYRYLCWLAKSRGIPFRMPQTHPFNPLPYLRLAIAARCERRAIDAIFEAVFTWGEDPASPAMLERLARALGITDAAAAIASPEVKDRLRKNTDDAIASGAFGVPTIVVDGEIFWGEESLGMLRDYLGNGAGFMSEDMRRLAAIVPSATRRG